MKKQWLVLTAIVVLLFIAVYQSADSNKEEIPRIGYKAPSFSLQGLDGETYSLNDLNGRPVVINFWASWCSPCKAEAPELVKLYQKYGEQIEIYAVNLTANDSVSNAKAFANNYKFTFPVLLDEDAVAAQKYNIAPIPTTFFVNNEGIIEDIVLGLVDPQTLESKFKQLLP